MFVPLVSSRRGDMLTAVGSTLASLMFFWAIIQKYCPPGLRRQIELQTGRLSSFFDPYIRITIHEFAGNNLKPHKAFTYVEAYLRENSSRNAKRLKAEMTHNDKLLLSMDEYEGVEEVFQGVKVWWAMRKVSSPMRSSSFFPPSEMEKRFYRLTFHRRHRELVSDVYLEHVMSKGKEIKTSTRQRRLYTNSQCKSMWSHVVFKHPATFDSLAMDPEQKQEIIEDLLTFSESKDFYDSIGRAWKRGYLLYGPPGTGKSTMIAAMANLLNYDVYDLELTSVKDNMELKRLLIETTTKSIIVIEDIDCSLDLTGQRKKQQEKPSEGEKEKMHKETSQKEQEGGSSKVTLSGLLNSIDGLWSACGRERIIVFTTNFVEKLDPALTRRGRMDRRIELSYCGFEGFKVLAKNYMKLEVHPLFNSIQQLIGECKITPADVAENLMPKSAKEDAERRLLNLIKVLEEAKNEAATKEKTKQKPRDEAVATENGSVEDRQEA